MSSSSNVYKKVVFGAISTAVLSLTASQVTAQSSTIAIDGSSTVFPITEAMAEEFMAVNSGVKTVGRLYGFL